MIIKKIAILRANALGDFLVTLPAIEAIKASYPRAEIVLLGAPWHEEFLIPGRCAVDRVEVVPEYEGIRGSNFATPQQMDAFFEKMREEDFDIAVHFQGNGLSANAFILELHAAISAGCTVEGAAVISRSIPFYYYQNEISRYLEVASLIDARPVSLEGTIHIMPSEKEDVMSFLELMTIQKFVVVHPFSADIRREWPLNNYPNVIDALFEKGYQTIITGLEKDIESVEEIISKTKHGAVNACGVFDLGALSALYNEAALVIAPDTGPLHLARAVKTPTVGIYWAPNFINWSPLLRGSNRALVSWKMECALCGVVPNDPYPFLPQEGCKHEISFVADITPEMVLREVEILLGNKEGEGMKSKKKLELISQSSA